MIKQLIPNCWREVCGARCHRSSNLMNNYNITELTLNKLFQAPIFLLNQLTELSPLLVHYSSCEQRTWEAFPFCHQLLIVWVNSWSYQIREIVSGFKRNQTQSNPHPFRINRRIVLMFRVLDWLPWGWRVQLNELILKTKKYG